MSVKPVANHCRHCGAELMECDGCHGPGMVHFDGPMDTETGYIGYDEPCSECGGRCFYAAAPELAEALQRLVARARILHFVETIPVGCETCDAIEDAEKLLARITPK